jgi:hypothetical protein
MFDHTSRYWSTPVAFWPDPSGRLIRYARRRLLPQPEGMQELAIWPVEPGDRFDLVAARTLGDPQAYWRIADANRVMDPRELEVPYRRLVIPMPQPGDT